ncbi:MAG: hypothetical protein JNK78_13185 [Planctomycetes bacterium]|nr:hypothetical protein [Planctomycetota bacterium]
MPPHPRWIVTTDDSRPIGQVATELRRLGFRVENVMSAIGSITGQASPAVAASARHVAGVTDVEPDAPIDIGPPEADQ